MTPPPSPGPRTSLDPFFPATEGSRARSAREQGTASIDWRWGGQIDQGGPDKEAVVGVCSGGREREGGEGEREREIKSQ